MMMQPSTYTCTLLNHEKRGFPQVPRTHEKPLIFFESTWSESGQTRCYKGGNLSIIKVSATYYIMPPMKLLGVTSFMIVYKTAANQGFWEVAL